jgi:phosphomannomutase
MKINPNIFKAYDIRGVYPEEINSSAALKIGEGLVRFLRKTKKGKLEIVIGMDNRLSSPVLCQAVKKGILKQGADVIDIGLSTTPMFYFAVWKYKFNGGIMITASHNPPEYNGFKIVREKSDALGKESGLEEIKKLSLEGKKKSKAKKGIVQKKNVLEEYLDFNFSQVNIGKIKNLKIGIDTANAVSGILIKELQKRLPCKIYHLFPELNGRFPNHLANPLEEKNIKDLKNFVKQKKLDLGIAFDGDGDRIIFVDEKGKMIPSDFITCLISERILKEKPGTKILYNICSSNIIKDVVKKNGGVPIMGEIGHTFIKQRMKREKMFFCGEFSGHYFLAPYFFEVPLFILFKILEEISQSGKTISRLVKPFQKYFHSGQINLKVEDKKKKLKELEKKFKGGRISHLDGLRIDFKDWWFNARASNTEDLLRIVVEARTKKLMEEKLKEIVTVIRTK